MSMLTGGLALAAGAAKCVEFVHAGEVAVKRRAGSYDSRRMVRFSTFSPYIHTYEAGNEGFRYGIKGRGLAFSWPGIERWVHISTLPNTDNQLPPQIVTCKEERQVKVGAAITWRVIDDEDAIYRALWAVNNNKAANIIPELRPLVIDTAAQQLAVVMNGKTFEEMHQFKDRQAEMMANCYEPMNDMGIGLDRVFFQSPYFTEADIAQQAMRETARIHARAAHEQAEASIQAAQTLAQAITAAGQSQPEAVAAAEQTSLGSRQPLESLPFGEQPAPLQVIRGSQL